MIDLLTHEYSLALYGVILWQIEEYLRQSIPWRDFLRPSLRDIGRSLVWVGAIVVFDDELLARYNAIAHVDYQQAPFWMYILAGFFVDIGRSKFTGKKDTE
jgi:hypothetical protein